MGSGRSMKHTGVACILVLLAVLVVPPAVQADSHVVYVPLIRNALLDDSLTWATVVRVSDGDTIKVNIDGCPIEGMKVRLIGIDTPERGECFWADAKERTEALVLGQRVALQRDVSEFGPYNRLLRHVYLGDETWVNGVLVGEGYARVTTYPPDDRYAGALGYIEAAARASEVGAWGDCGWTSP